MAWESSPGVPLTLSFCAQLEDKATNGNRGRKDLRHHLEDESLVDWAFNPGISPNGEDQTKPQISHEALAHAFKQCMGEGAPRRMGES